MIILYLDLIFFVLSIEYNFAENWLSIFLRFFENFIFYSFYIVHIYFYFPEILFVCFLVYLFGNIYLDRFFIFERILDLLQLLQNYDRSIIEEIL
jgi:hypothetical protein